MKHRTERACHWLPGTRVRVVRVPQATWWLALSRSPVGLRYRSRRTDLKRICGQKKGSGL